jgi:hypothetical protein
MSGLTSADYTILIGMFVILLLLLAAYAVEYGRHKTARKEKRTRITELLFIWLALIGLFCWIRISPIWAGVAWTAAILGYLFDGYFVDKTP